MEEKPSLGDKIAEIGARFLAKGTETFLDSFEDAQRTDLKDAVSKLPALPEDVPEEIRGVQDKAVGAEGFPWAIAMAVFGVALAIGSVTGLVQSSAKYGSHTFEKWFKNFRFGPGEATNLWLREYPSTEDKEQWFDDLKDQGADDRRIEAIKELAHYLPTPTEVMTWAAREVFEPELRERYQLDTHLPPEYLAWAAKVGITGEVALNYWAAHWVLPSLTSIIELWRRGELTKEDVDSFWTELDMVPWIREKLFILFREVPTRVDVRRWWDMGTITEPRLRQIYKAMGYWEEDLEDYVLWTKVYTAFPDLIARYKNGWITEQEVKDELIGFGMPEDRMLELWQTKFKKPVSVERVATERDLTKAEIYAGVKKEVITWDKGIEYLEAMGYDAAEAKFILDVRVGAASSPETPLEYRQLVESYRRSQGMEAKEIPEDMLAVEREFVSISRQLKEATERGDSQEVLDQLEVARADAMVRLRELLVLYEL